MKKTIISGLLILLIVLGFSTITLGATSKSNVLIGPGLGIPYGVIGGNLEIGVGDYFAVCGGLGISPGGMGWAVGGRIYLAGKDSRVRPRLGYYRGVVGYVDYLYKDDENVEGNAAGLGLLFKINDRMSIDGEIIYIDTWEYTAEDPDSRYKISVGVRFAL